MKRTKIFSILLVICLTITTLVSCGGEGKYEELKLKTTEIVTCKNNSLGITGVVDYDNANVAQTDAITVNSTANNIAKFENDKLVFGNEYGTASVDIIIGNKKGTVSVKVVPYAEYLYSLANKDGASGFAKMDYYASSWLINNLGDFKNPSSVSVEEVLYVENTVGTDGFHANYLIMEIRAQNSFGGYNVDYYKVTSSSITEVTIDSYGGFFMSYNGQSLYKSSAYSVNKAIQEHIAENY